MVIHQEESKTIVENYTTDYGKYVLQSRAIPSVIDGLKPVQRRFLNSAMELKLWNRGGFLKSAKLAGDVMGNFHPHGNGYGTLVGLTQEFKIRYPLFEGQGNWGCPDLPHSVAADRYTETKLSKFAEDFYIKDADYGDYERNYDDRLDELVLAYPVIPGSLLTGAAGIAIGISTEIPTHTISDVSNSLLKYIEDPTSEDFLDLIVPETNEPSTLMSTRDEIKQMYRDGRGSIRYGAKFHYEVIDGKSALVVDSFPPDYSKKRLETAAIMSAVEKGNLELLNDSTDKVRYVFISSDKEVLTTIEGRLTKSIGYRFFMYHKGEIRLYDLSSLYDIFIEERVKFIVRKYTTILGKDQHELDYLEALYKLKQDKNYIKDMFDKTSDVVIAEIVSMYNTTDKIASRLINSSLRSLMADNFQQILTKIDELKNSIVEYSGYISNPKLKMIADIEELRDAYANEERNSKFLSDQQSVYDINFKGETIQIGEYTEYLVAKADNTITRIVGLDLVGTPLDDAVSVLAIDKKYYLAYDNKGLCAMESDTLIRSGNKFKSDNLVGLVGVNDLTEILLTRGNSKTAEVDAWALRKRSSYIQLSTDTQPDIIITIK